MDYDNQLKHFSLRWNDYNDNMKTGFHDLLRREDFVDVTIAAEGKLVQAHKMVLSICSPYFKKIFKTNPCQHPVVFLKDVTHKELSGILQFMYLGEVSVQQEELGRFLKTAEALQIKGLTNGDSHNKVEVSEPGNAWKQNSCNYNRNKSKVLHTDVPDRPESKKSKVDSANKDFQLLNALPNTKYSDETSINEDSQEYSRLSNEFPVLDLCDVEYERVVIKEEQNEANSCQLQGDRDATEINSSPKPGLGCDILNSVQADSCKSLENNQGSHVSPVLTKNQGLCPICGRILQHKKNLQTHIVDQHSGIFGCWPCQICHKVCRTWSALRVHTNRHHMKLENGNGPLPFVGVTQKIN